VLDSTTVVSITLGIRAAAPLLTKAVATELHSQSAFQTWTSKYCARIDRTRDTSRIRKAQNMRMVSRQARSSQKEAIQRR
jgi:hypothetical protein